MKEYKYKGKKYTDCDDLLDKLIEDGYVESITSTSYFVDGEFIGDDCSDGADEIVQTVFDNYGGEIE